MGDRQILLRGELVTAEFCLPVFEWRACSATAPDEVDEAYFLTQDGNRGAEHLAFDVPNHHVAAVEFTPGRFRVYVPDAETKRFGNQPLHFHYRAFCEKLLARLVKCHCRRDFLGLALPRLIEPDFGDDHLFLRRQPDSPGSKKIRICHSVPLSLPARRPQTILFLRISNSLLLRNPINLSGAPRKLVDDRSRNAL